MKHWNTIILFLSVLTCFDLIAVSLPVPVLTSGIHVLGMTISRSELPIVILIVFMASVAEISFVMWLLERKKQSH